MGFALNKQYTYGELYNPMTKVQTIEEAQDWYNDILWWMTHKTKDAFPWNEATQIIRANALYYLGYFSAETYARVSKLLENVEIPVSLAYQAEEACPPQIPSETNP